jgi:hypothetical protein
MEFVRHVPELLPKRLLVQVESVERPFDPHKEHPGLIVLMLIGMQDISAMGIEEISDRGYDPPPVWAVE